VSWRLLVVAAAVAAVVLALVHLRLVVLPVLVALVFTALLSVPNRVLRRRLPDTLAAVVTVLGAVLLLGAVASLIAPSVAAELGQVDDRVRQGINEVTEWLTMGPLDLNRDDLERAIRRAGDRLGADSGAITRRLLSGALLVGELAVGLLLALVLTFFFLKDGPYLWRWLTGLFAEPTRRDLREIGTRGWDTLTGYLSGIAIVATVDAVLIGLLLVIVGVPLVVPLALLTFIGAFFPLVGAFVAGLVATLVALVSGGAVDALIVLAGIVVVQQVEGDLLHPIVVGRAVELHPVTILLSVATGGILAGVAGAFIAVPIAAVASSTAAYLRERP